jgi:hypothetical protein
LTLTLARRVITLIFTFKKGLATTGGLISDWSISSKTFTRSNESG